MVLFLHLHTFLFQPRCHCIRPRPPDFSASKSRFLRVRRGCFLTDGTSYLRVRLGWMGVPWRVQTIPTKPWRRLCHVLLVPDAKNIHAAVPPITPCGRLDGPGSGLERPVRCHLKPRRGSALSEDRLPTILMVCHINPKPITTQWAKIPILQSSSNWNCVPKLSPRNQKLWRHIHIYIQYIYI